MLGSAAYGMLAGADYWEDLFNGTGFQVLQLSSDFRSINVKSSSELQIVWFLWELTVDVIPSMYSEQQKNRFCVAFFLIYGAE